MLHLADDSDKALYPCGGSDQTLMASWRRMHARDRCARAQEKSVVRTESTIAQYAQHQPQNNLERYGMEAC